MIDIEKVIKGVHDARRYLEDREWVDKSIGVHIDALNDALILLKEQEAKHGEWITIWEKNDPDISTCAKCSICNRVSERPLGMYCKWCGTKMNQE